MLSKNGNEFDRLEQSLKLKQVPVKKETPSCVKIFFVGNEEFSLPYESFDFAKNILSDIQNNIISGFKAKTYFDCDMNPLLVIFENILFAYAIPLDCD